MNIFYLDNHTHRCAKQHCDKHVVKMIIEYAQLLSTAHRVIDGIEYTDLSKNGRRIKRWKMVKNSNMEETLYKAAMVNHPSAVWVRQSSRHYQWLYRLFMWLCVEYTYRYGKIHSTERLLGDLLGYTPKGLQDKGFVEPPQCMPDYCKVKGNSIKAYKNYYINEKQYFAKWTKQKEPEWYTEGTGTHGAYAS